MKRAGRWLSIIVALALLAAGVVLHFRPLDVPSWAILIAVILAPLCAAVLLSAPKREWLEAYGVFPAVFGVALVLAQSGDAPAALQSAGGALLLAGIATLRRSRVVAEAERRPLAGQAKVRLVREGQKKRPEVPAESIVPGDHIAIGDGEEIPADGVVVEGSGFVDESALSGFSLPQAKRADDPVFAASMNQSSELIVRVERSRAESLVAQKARAASLLFDELATGPAAPLLSSLPALLAGVGGGVLLYLGKGSLPVFAALGLAAGAGLPGAVLRRGRLGLLSLASDHGVIVTRRKDLLALAKSRRWQVDPHLLSAAGSVETVQLADTPGDVLLAVAEALYADTAGPERATLASARGKKKLERLPAAALKETDGVRHGTIDGRRWFIGNEAALQAVEKVVPDESAHGTLDFLKERSHVVLLVGRPDDGLLGAVGLSFGVDQGVRIAAQTTKATIMPGLPDPVRRALAEEAKIECDGPPLGARDATLLGEDAPAPSAGLRLRVVEPRLGLELKTDAAPKLLAPATASLGVLIPAMRRLYQHAIWQSAAAAVAPPLAALGLGLIGGLAPITGLGIALAAGLLTRLPPAETSASMELDQSDSRSAK